MKNRKGTYLEVHLFFGGFLAGLWIFLMEGNTNNRNGGHQ